MEEKKRIPDSELNAEGGTAVNDFGRLSPYGGDGMVFAAAEHAAAPAHTGDTMVLADSELNAEGGKAVYTGGWTDLDLVIPASDTDALAGGQQQRGAPGWTDFAVLSDNEADKVSAGMVAGLEEISGGELYVGEYKGEMIEGR